MPNQDKKKITMDSKEKLRHVVVVEKWMEFRLTNFNFVSFSQFLLELIYTSIFPPGDH